MKNPATGNVPGAQQPTAGGGGRCCFAGVADAVIVGIRLVGVLKVVGQLSPGVALAVAVGVRLVGVESVRTVVAGVAHSVAVGVSLTGIGHGRTNCPRPRSGRRRPRRWPRRSGRTRTHSPIRRRRCRRS